MIWGKLRAAKKKATGILNHRWHRFFNHEGTKKTKKYLIADNADFHRFFGTDGTGSLASRPGK